MRNTFLALVACMLVTTAPATAAGPHDALLRNMVETAAKQWLSRPVVIDSIKARNGRHEQLSQAEIERMDQQWRAETRSTAQPLIDTVLSNPLSELLKQVKQSAGGLYTEIFVMDKRGLNVGQSDVTSDYWQGDEPKWQRTFPLGAGATFVDEVEFDESAQQCQAQVSMAIVDPASNQAIGAVTFGVNVELLQ